MLRQHGRTARAKAWRQDRRGSLVGFNSPADSDVSGHIGTCLIPAMPLKTQIKAYPLHETWQTSPKTVCSEMSLTPSGLSYNVCEFWDLSSQVIYLKGTFITCTRNGYLSLKIYLPLFLFITESWRLAWHSTTRKKVVFSFLHLNVSMCPCSVQLNLRGSYVCKFRSLPWQRGSPFSPYPPSCCLKQGLQ